MLSQTQILPLMLLFCVSDSIYPEVSAAEIRFIKCVSEFLYFCTTHLSSSFWYSPLAFIFASVLLAAAARSLPFANTMP